MKSISLQTYMNMLLRLVILVTGFAVLSPSWCQTTDQTVYLEADKVEIDEKTGISKYLGNVKLNRGNLTILADTMMIFKTGKMLNRVSAKGHPVKFNKQRSAEEKEIRGQALQLEYDAQKETLELKQDAKLWQEQDQFTGDFIQYNIQQEIVHASKGGSDDRVRVIIHPQSNK